MTKKDFEFCTMNEINDNDDLEKNSDLKFVKNYKSELNISCNSKYTKLSFMKYCIIAVIVFPIVVGGDLEPSGSCYSNIYNKYLFFSTFTDYDVAKTFVASGGSSTGSTSNRVSFTKIPVGKLNLFNFFIHKTGISKDCLI